MNLKLHRNASIRKTRPITEVKLPSKIGKAPPHEDSKDGLMVGQLDDPLKHVPKFKLTQIHDEI